MTCHDPKIDATVEVSTLPTSPMRLGFEGRDHHVESSPTELTGTGKILVVDDSLLVRRRVQMILENSDVRRAVETAPDGRSALEHVATGSFDLVLCDLNMPGVGGLEFLELVRELPAGADLPVIMLTGEEGIGPKVKCLESGASDYLIKPFADEELVARTRIHLQLKSLRDELRATNYRLGALARVDALTGISNRYHFLETMAKEISRAEREEKPLSVAMIDVDRFKKINDDHGHLSGDEALVRVAHLLRESLRSYDLLGRYGGEEFAAVLVDTDGERAERIAQRCCRNIAAKPLLVGGDKLCLTVSIGVVSAPHPEPGSVNELISRADEALYLAKNLGRNRVVLLAAPGSDG